MPTTTTDDINVEVIHDDERHIVEIYVTRVGDFASMVDSRGSWSALRLPIAVLPCAVWNEIYAQMQDDVIADWAQLFGGPA